MDIVITEKKKANKTEAPLPMLPRNIIVGALKYADKIEGTDRMIPHENVMAEIYKRRGWQ